MLAASIMALKLEVIAKPLLWVSAGQQDREAVTPLAAALIQGSLFIAGEHQLMALAQHVFRQGSHRDAFRAAARAAEGDEQRGHVALEILTRTGQQIRGRDRFDPAIEPLQQQRRETLADESRTARPG